MEKTKSNRSAGEGTVKNKREKQNRISGLSAQFITMAILPILILGVFIVGMSARMYTDGLHREVSSGLASVARTVLASYDQNVPGDYNLLVDNSTGEMFLRKGEKVISDDTGLIDRIKEETGIDTSLFFYDCRLMTTITDAQGNRITGTKVHETVLNEVVAGKEAHFYESVRIGGTDYFVQYIPILAADGTCVGMIGTAKPSSEVAALVNRSMMTVLVVIVIAVLLVAVIISRFSAGLVSTLRRMMRFLGEIARGELDAQLDETISARKDEIGEMGRFTLRVQSSLRKLIERDALTGLYNRRYGEKKADQILEENSCYSVAMGDIDFFKKVNDTYGHEAGDDVLRMVARLLSEGMKGHGFVSRWGGEEFLMIFDRENAGQAASVLQGILSRIRETVVHSGEYDISVTMSYGVVTGVPGLSRDAQIKLADNGLYYAKEHGRNQIVNLDEPAAEEEAPEEECMPETAETGEECVPETAETGEESMPETAETGEESIPETLETDGDTTPEGDE